MLQRHRHLRARGARPGRDGAPARRRARQGPALAGRRARRRGRSATPTPTTFRPRPAYRFCLEDSIYLAPDAPGQGVGRLLLAELLARCEAARRAPDAGRDRRFGQRRLDRRAPRARLRARPARSRPRGWKFDRWLDVVLMQGASARATRRAGRRRRDRAAPARARKTGRDLARAASAAASGCTASTCTARATPGPGCIRWPTLVGAYGVLAHARSSARTTSSRWLLIPLLGADAGGDDAGGDRLRPDARRALGRALQRRRRPRAHAAGRPCIGVVVALLLGATVLMATIAFTAPALLRVRSAEPQSAVISEQQKLSAVEDARRRRPTPGS